MDSKQLLANLYDNIYDLITAGSDENSKSSLRVQMVQGEVLNLEDFAGALSSSTPKGDITKAETLSVFVDKVPNLNSQIWDPKEGLAKFYKDMVTESNIDPNFSPTEEQEALYKKLQGFLRAEVEHTSVLGTKSVTLQDTPLFVGYQEAASAYEAALFDAEEVMLNADLSTNQGKREASLDKRRADAEVQSKYKAWVAAGKSDVDEILNALESTKNNAISSAIEDARAIMEDKKWLPSLSGGQPWMLSSVTPSNWTEPTCKGTTFKVSSDKLKTSTSTSATTYSNKSKGWFWSGSSEDSASIDKKTASMEAESFNLEAELVLVRVHRPWLNQLLFTMKGWSNNAYTTENPISDGKGGGALPAIPTAFVMMRNVSIEAKFNSSDSSFIETQSQSKSTSGWGWGPFGRKNHESSSHSTSDKFESTANGVKLTFGQPQIVAWVNSIVPQCPPAPAK